jgi:hypothetical protein
MVAGAAMWRQNGDVFVNARDSHSRQLHVHFGG